MGPSSEPSVNSVVTSAAPDGAPSSAVPELDIIDPAALAAAASELRRATGPVEFDSNITSHVRNATSGLAKLCQDAGVKDRVAFLTERFLTQPGVPPDVERAANELLSLSRSIEDAIGRRLARSEEFDVPVTVEEFEAVGESVAALAMAIYDRTLVARVIGFNGGDKSNVRDLETRLERFCTEALVGPDSPVGTLLVKEATGKNCHFESALLRGAFRVVLSIYDEIPPSLGSKMRRALLNRDVPGRERLAGVKEGELTAREFELIEELIKVAEDTEPHRRSVFHAHEDELARAAQEQENLQRERDRLAARRSELASAQAVSKRLAAVQALPEEERIPALVEMLYTGVSLTAEQGISILDSITLGARVGRTGGYTPLRDEMRSRHLGDFGDPAWEPIDRLVAWLAIHRIDHVADPAVTLEALTKKTTAILEGAAKWKDHAPTYRTALRDLFLRLIEETCAEDGPNRKVKLATKADQQ